MQQTCVRMATWFVDECVCLSVCQTDCGLCSLQLSHLTVRGMAPTVGAVGSKSSKQASTLTDKQIELLLKCPKGQKCYVRGDCNTCLWF